MICLAILGKFRFFWAWPTIPNKKDFLSFFVIWMFIRTLKSTWSYEFLREKLLKRKPAISPNWDMMTDASTFQSLMLSALNRFSSHFKLFQHYWNYLAPQGLFFVKLNKYGHTWRCLKKPRQICYFNFPLIWNSLDAANQKDQSITSGDTADKINLWFDTLKEKKLKPFKVFETILCVLKWLF